MIGWVKLNAQSFLAPDTLNRIHTAMLARVRVPNYVNTSKRLELVCFARPPTESTA